MDYILMALEQNLFNNGPVYGEALHFYIYLYSR